MLTSIHYHVYEKFEVFELEGCCGWAIISNISPSYEDETGYNKINKQLKEDLRKLTSLEYKQLFPIIATINSEQIKLGYNTLLEKYGFKEIQETVNPNTGRVIKLYHFIPSEDKNGK